MTISLLSTFSPLFNICLLVGSVKLYHQGTMSIFTCMRGPKLFIELQVQPHQYCTIGTKPPILKHQLPCNKGQFAFLTTCYLCVIHAQEHQEPTVIHPCQCSFLSILITKCLISHFPKLYPNYAKFALTHSIYVYLVADKRKSSLQHALAPIDLDILHGVKLMVTN